jgi:hypothetical protein
MLETIYVIVHVIVTIWYNKEATQVIVNTTERWQSPVECT